MTKEKTEDRRIIHGVLMAVFGHGTLIRGASGSGKSEVGLELIARGHRLVADDAVRISRRGHQLFGEAPELTAGVLAVSGLGLVDVAAVFGENSLQAETTVDLCVDLAEGPETDALDLLSDVPSVVEMLGVQIPLVSLDISRRPPSPVIVETAVRMLEHPSARVARRVASKHDSSLIHPSTIPQ